jgi:hypothetical protein
MHVLASGCRSWDASPPECSVRPTSETARRGPTAGIQMLRFHQTRSLSTRITVTVSHHAPAASCAAILRPQTARAQTHVVDRAAARHTTGIDTTWLGCEEQLHGAATRYSSFAPSSLCGRTRFDHVALFGRACGQRTDRLSTPSTTTSPLGSLHHHRCPALARTWPQLCPVASMLLG